MDSIVRPDGSAPAISIQALVDTWRALKRQAPPPVRWVVYMRYSTYLSFQKPMRKKMARYARIARRRAE